MNKQIKQMAEDKALEKYSTDGITVGTDEYYDVLSNRIGYAQAIIDTYKEDENNDGWISVKDRLPEIDLVGQKVLLHRHSDHTQKLTEISIHETRLVKHCHPKETHWMLLPNPPKEK